MRRWSIVSAASAVLVGALVATMLGRSGRSRPAAQDSSSVESPPPVEADEPLTWLAASSGSTPEFNPVSLEQDLALAASVLGGRGRVLFGAGADRPVVQVLAPNREPDPLRIALGALFRPREGREAAYRAPKIAVDGPATAATVLAQLRAALDDSDVPFLLFLGGHGYVGETPSENTVGFWGGSSISARQLSAVLDEYHRPTHLVITTCFSGGFGEMVFDDGVASRGPSPTIRCGLFASPWDLEASGCDPNPDRSRQEGYALHFFNALAGRDRDGTPLDGSSIDLDHNGRVSLLEAHTRVRIASSSPDVPTSTSERWLRHQFPTGVPLPETRTRVGLREERHVLETLLSRLGLSSAEGAESRLQAIERRWTTLDHELVRLQRLEDEAFFAASSELLARWPVLDDPWHPGFSATMQESRDEIADHLETSERYAAYLQARAAVDRQSAAMADLRTAAAPLERIVRAAETIAMAQALASRGGPPWDRYAELLACERWEPPLGL